MATAWSKSTFTVLLNRRLASSDKLSGIVWNCLELKAYPLTSCGELLKSNEIHQQVKGWVVKNWEGLMLLDTGEGGGD